MSTEENNYLTVDNLVKWFGSDRAVDDISFSIEKGSFLTLLGPSGCGKTTTIGMILGLLKPSNGEILINGMDIEKNKISVLNKINFCSLYLLKILNTSVIDFI